MEDPSRTFRTKLFQSYEAQRMPVEQREFLLEIDERLGLESKYADNLRYLQRTIDEHITPESHAEDVSSHYRLVLEAEASLGADVAKRLAQQDKANQLDMGDRIKLLGYAMNPFPHLKQNTEENRE